MVVLSLLQQRVLRPGSPTAPHTTPLEVIVLVYADAADLQEWTGTTAPSNAAQLLRSASVLVRRATMTAWYATDATGAPTATAVADAMRDATCAQVTTWIALAIDPAKGAADGGRVIASKSLGSGSVQYAVYASTVERRARAATELDQEPLLILAAAGLVNPTAGATR